jgi:hypothetical protein
MWKWTIALSAVGQQGQDWSQLCHPEVACRRGASAIGGVAAAMAWTCGGIGHGQSTRSLLSGAQHPKGGARRGCEASRR